jgi:hypothetical protein
MQSAYVFMEKSQNLRLDYSWKWSARTRDGCTGFKIASVSVMCLYCQLVCLGAFPAANVRRVPRIVMAGGPESERMGRSEGGMGGVLPGFKNWPPQPITEHGRPKPEDDPVNLAAE